MNKEEKELEYFNNQVYRFKFIKTSMLLFTESNIKFQNNILLFCVYQKELLDLRFYFEQIQNDVTENKSLNLFLESLLIKLKKVYFYSESMLVIYQEHNKIYLK